MLSRAPKMIKEQCRQRVEPVVVTSDVPLVLTKQQKYFGTCGIVNESKNVEPNEIST